MERNIALFVSNRQSFFREEVWINCPIDCYCACEGANILFDIDEVLKKELVDVGNGVKMSRPLKLEKDLLTGEYISVSLSHKGILAICANIYTVQFTDLNNGRQVDMEVECCSTVGFYDDMMILLVNYEPLREARVEDMFDVRVKKKFKKIKETDDFARYTDVSLLHERRVLYYPTMYGALCSFNVDTRENTVVDLESIVYTISSFTGIDCGLKCVFWYCDNSTCILDMNSTMTKVNNSSNDMPITLFPSTSNPKTIKDAVFKYGDHLVKNGDIIDTSNMINFDGYNSVVRIYRDIFLVYDCSVKSWILMRIIVS